MVVEVVEDIVELLFVRVDFSIVEAGLVGPGYWIAAVQVLVERVYVGCVEFVAFGVVGE